MDGAGTDRFRGHMGRGRRFVLFISAELLSLLLFVVDMRAQTTASARNETKPKMGHRHNSVALERTKMHIIEPRPSCYALSRNPIISKVRKT
jgi:hypothetical protein